MSSIRKSTLLSTNKTAALAGTAAVAAAFFVFSYPSNAYLQSIPFQPKRTINQHSVQFASLDNNEKISSFPTTTCSAKAQDRFRGRSILLTGATGGLGRALALQLAKCGAGKIILSSRNEQALREVATDCLSIAENGGTAVEMIACNLSDLEEVKNLGSKAGEVDVLINNGGISSRSRFLDTKIEVDELLMRVNFLSGALLAKMVVPAMVERGEGAVIWISSVQGLLGIPNRSSYAASKFAVQGYCESLRAELATNGISVHVISPGYIRTNLSRSAIKGDGELYNKMDDTTASGADPNDVAMEILDAVAREESEVIVAATLSARVGLWLKFWAPSFLQKMLMNRYEKSNKE